MIFNFGLNKALWLYAISCNTNGTNGFYTANKIEKVPALYVLRSNSYIEKARQTILAETRTYGNLFSRENIRERMFVEQVKISHFFGFFLFFFSGMNFFFFLRVFFYQMIF